MLFGVPQGEGEGVPPYPPPVTLVSVTVQVLYGESHGMILAKVTFFSFYFEQSFMCCHVWLEHTQELNKHSAVV